MILRDVRWHLSREKRVPAGSKHRPSVGASDFAQRFEVFGLERVARCAARVDPVILAAAGQSAMLAAAKQFEKREIKRSNT
jgi:hypothetical protein